MSWLERDVKWELKKKKSCCIILTTAVILVVTGSREKDFVRTGG
jgi:hypothetical protein